MGASSLLNAGSSVLGASSGKKGASKAAKAQSQAYQQALGLQQNEFNTINGYAAPNVNAGNAANEQIRRLLGLGDSNTGQSANGNPAYSAEQQQQGALDNLRQSPLFQGAYNTGTDTILANAAATGGLRGGNTQNSLADFGSQLFSNVYQNDLSNLFNLSGVGQNALGSLAGAGQNFANQSSNLLGQQGNANAVGAAAPYAAIQQALSGIGGSLGNNSGGAWNGSGAFPSSAYGW